IRGDPTEKGASPLDEPEPEPVGGARDRAVSQLDTQPGIARGGDLRPVTLADAAVGYLSEVGGAGRRADGDVRTGVQRHRQRRLEPKCVTVRGVGERQHREATPDIPSQLQLSVSRFVGPRRDARVLIQRARSLSSRPSNRDRVVNASRDPIRDYDTSTVRYRSRSITSASSSILMPRRSETVT